MGFFTNFLKLFKYDREEDRDKTFNIDTALNENWDKVDVFAQNHGHKPGDVAQDANNRFMTDAERTKLNGIATSANNYSHPANHPPSIITQDANNRFVTDTEKSTWNGKAGTAAATQTANGLMSAADKTKLDGVATGANNYTHPANHPPSIITQDANNRFMTDTERTKLNGIAASANNYTHPANHPPSIITQDASNRFMTDAERTKLNGIAASANNYTHPANHPASIITQDANNRFVTDTEKANWNGKAGTTAATQTANGLMSAADKAKLDGVAAGAINYTHPANHPPSIITQDANNRFMTDTERTKLNGIAASANNYTHPTNHPPSIITQDANNRFVTDTEKSTWNGKATGTHNHTRSQITDFPASMPASDVSAWAKAAAKPTYTAAEVGAEPAFSKNSAFNKNFGTAAGTVCDGNDARLSNARTPTSHATTATTFGIADGVTYGHVRYPTSATTSTVPQSALPYNYLYAADGAWNLNDYRTAGVWVLYYPGTGALNFPEGWGTGTGATAILEVLPFYSNTAVSQIIRKRGTNTAFIRHSTSATAWSGWVSIGQGHTHAAGDINSGTLAYARLPVGNASNTVCAGNDSRLSDARTPTAHNQDWNTITGKPASYAPVAHNHSIQNITTAYATDQDNNPSGVLVNTGSGQGRSCPLANFKSALGVLPSAQTPAAHNQGASTITSGTFNSGTYRFPSDITPYSAEQGNCGTSNYWWSNIYASLGSSGSGSANMRWNPSTFRLMEVNSMRAIKRDISDFDPAELRAFALGLRPRHWIDKQDYKELEEAIKLNEAEAIAEIDTIKARMKTRDPDREKRELREDDDRVTHLEGRLRRKAISRKYKQTLKDIPRIPGFVAEEVLELPLGEFFVEKQMCEKDGQRLLGLAYDRICVALVSTVQQQETEIVDLRTRLERLEKAVFETNKG